MVQQRWLLNAGVIIMIIVVDTVLAWWLASLWLGGWLVSSADAGDGIRKNH